MDIHAGDYELRVTGSVLEFDGFTALYTEGTDDENEEAEARLPDGLKKDDALMMMALLPEQHFTKPPPRFSEATLVKELESREIGRPSTYAQIISTLQDRDYAEINSGRFSPSDLGRTVNGILVQAFPDVFNVDFTARLEDELDQVEKGEVVWVKVVEDFYGPFCRDLDRAEGQRKQMKAALQEETDRICEKCGNVFVIKWGRNGRFPGLFRISGVSQYPSTRGVRVGTIGRGVREMWLRNGDPYRAERTFSGLLGVPGV